MSWQLLEEELARWHDAGRTVDFWCRDDAAAAPSAAVRQLLQLSKASGVPLAPAVIPLGAKPELFEALGSRVLMHGPDHRNRAAAAEKKSEFPLAEPEGEAIGPLAPAAERLAGRRRRACTCWC